MKPRPAKYLIRFDDICPTMNWHVWKKIEQILIQQQIDPILAVVPDNKDERLVVGPAFKGFWDSVRVWQGRRWAIGIHGYQHLYLTNRPGLVGINRRSEFAGLEEHEQEAKLKSALNLFGQEKITPEIWIAPAHTFDGTTLLVLKKLAIDVVSDGFYLWPNTDSLGVTHVPQQLWRFRPMPFGLWTVCYHHNTWSLRDVERFESDIKRYRDRITSLRRVLAVYRPRNHNLADAFFARSCRFGLQTRNGIRSAFRTMTKPFAARANIHG